MRKIRTDRITDTVSLTIWEVEADDRRTIKVTCSCGKYESPRAFAERQALDNALRHVDRVHNK